MLRLTLRQIANEKGSTEILQAYRGKDIVLTLPGGKTLRDVRLIEIFQLIFNFSFIICRQNAIFMQNIQVAVGVV